MYSYTRFNSSAFVFSREFSRVSTTFEPKLKLWDYYFLTRREAPGVFSVRNIEVLAIIRSHYTQKETRCNILAFLTARSRTLAASAIMKDVYGMPSRTAISMSSNAKAWDHGTLTDNSLTEKTKGKGNLNSWKPSSLINLVPRVFSLKMDIKIYTRLMLS